MNKGDKICTINGIDFFYGGWNGNGWHLVYTNLENFHVGDNILQLPTERDCQRLYRNYYESTPIAESFCLENLKVRLQWIILQ